MDRRFDFAHDFRVFIVKRGVKRGQSLSSVEADLAEGLRRSLACEVKAIGQGGGEGGRGRAGGCADLAERLNGTGAAARVRAARRRPALAR